MRFGSYGPSLGAVILLAAAAAALFSGDGDGEGDAAPTPAPVETGDADARGEVVNVIDGDTAEIRVDGDLEHVRYIGIDTPESYPPERAECFGDEASRRNEELVEGREVALVYDEELRDDYGRLLAYVYADDSLVQETLLREGFATTLEVEPNTSMASTFAALQSAAIAEGTGLWSACEA